MSVCIQPFTTIFVRPLFCSPGSVSCKLGHVGYVVDNLTLRFSPSALVFHASSHSSSCSVFINDINDIVSIILTVTLDSKHSYYLCTYSPLSICTYRICSKIHICEITLCRDMAVMKISYLMRRVYSSFHCFRYVW